MINLTVAVKTVKNDIADLSKRAVRGARRQASWEISACGDAGS
jgi:hypothetical protein